MTKESKPRSYRGAEITVTFDARRCIHAARCVHGLPEVFDADRRPWIDPDGAAAERVAEAVRACPTGALQYEAAGIEAERPEERNTVTVRPDGPLHLRGDLTFVRPDGGESRATRAALCRCGASRNRPYCDNSHGEAGFADPGEVTDPKLAPVDEEAARAGLKITCAPNGPLLVEGPMELCDGSSKTVAGGGKGALCRCGASANKPFCDGSHVAIGFEAEA